MNLTLTDIYFGNELSVYLEALLALVFLVLLFNIFQKVVLWRLTKAAEKTNTQIDDTFVRILKSVRPPSYVIIAIYLSANFLALTPFTSKLLGSTVIAILTYQTIDILRILIDYWSERHLMGHSQKEGSQSAVNTINTILKIILWIIGGLFILQNFGVNVSSLLAGLGIGGIAIALAAQNILGDLFSSFAILIDKPFVPGDFIVIGEKMGTVEKIGIKTTRLRSTQGEEVIVNNQDLTSKTVQNFKNMKDRRVAITFGVVYDTPVVKLKKVRSIVKLIINAEKNTRFDRIHLVELGDSSLNFELVYFVGTNDYAKHLGKQQKILFKILAKFEEIGVDLAFPTSTVYVKK